MPKLINPIQNLFTDIEKIMNFIAIKNKIEADKYETVETSKEAALWIHAMMKEDSYLTYQHLYTHAMFQQITPNLKYQIIDSWLKNIYNVPLIYRDHLLEIGRSTVINNYVEKNDYYRMLNGQPPINATSKDFIYLSDNLKQLYGITTNIPVHELTDAIQNKYILTDEYNEILANNPDKEYLRYLGLYRIDIYIARRARDFQLIRYIPMDRNDVNPYLLKEFATLYNQYRDYVVRTIYNVEYIDLFENYREFISLIIVAFVLMQLCSKSVEHTSDNRFIDDTIIQTIFQMYGIPRSLIMTQEVKRKLVVSLNKLIRSKATNPVFYDLVKILKYDNITISKFMMIKQQIFGDDGQALFSDGTPINSSEDLDLLTTINPETGTPFKSLNTDIYFEAVDLKSKNTYNDMITSKSKTFNYSDVTGADPRWWELPDTQAAIKNKYYSYSDSKYIMIESMVDQTASLFESIYFLRMLVDNKNFTDTFMISVPEVFSNEKISLFDLSVFIMAAMCENNNLTGEIISSASGLLAVAGFNFELDLDLFRQFINTTKYTDKDRILGLINNLSMKSPSDINRLFNDVMIPLRDWLTYEISRTNNKDQFNEYEKIYRALFVYDAVRSVFVDNFISPVDKILAEFRLSNDDWQAFSLFYPHKPSGSAITVEEMVMYPSYFPFLGTGLGESKKWYVTTPNGDNVYFFDIINSPDLRYINNNGTLIKNPIWWNGDKVDESIVRSVIGQINALNDNELNNAYFKVTTVVPNSNRAYTIGEKLPVAIRNEIFKKILISKVRMDMNGEAQPAATYKDYIIRKNPRFEALFDKAETSRDSWMNDLMNIVIAIENELNMHLKYFEQTAVGNDMFFKPLITLIKYFKSHMIDFAGSSIRYIFADKMDAGGNSNMVKVFDAIHSLIYNITLAGRGENVEFGLYDTKHKSKYNLVISDASDIIQNGILNNGDKIINLRKYSMGSLRMIDECKFFKNGKEVDPSGQSSSWISGEVGVGRYIDDSDHTKSSYKGTDRVLYAPVDTEAWKMHVESYNP
jgi:hypothetical protein